MEFLDDTTEIPLLRTAREFARLSQSTVAQRAGLSQAVYSRVESGERDVTGAELRRLAEAVGVRPELLAVSASERPAGLFVVHRKRSTLRTSDAKSFHALLEMAALALRRMFGSRDELASVTDLRHPLDDDGLTSPAEIAGEVRNELHLGTEPIQDLRAALNALGVFVFEYDFGTRSIDAISAWPASGWPLIIHNLRMPTDRQRFTIAHELGHLLMHVEVSPGQESEADEFASGLLLPAAGVRNELEPVTIAHLSELKAKWKASIASLIRRSLDLGVIDHSRYRSLMIDYTRAGMRSGEPSPIIESESPTVFDQAPTMGLDASARDWLRDRSLLSDQVLSQLMGV